MRKSTLPCADRPHGARRRTSSPPFRPWGRSPPPPQSGQWKGKAMIAGGRKSVRSALFLASLAACRHNPVLKAFRQRLIDAGKPKMLVAIAAARKLLTILNAILRDKQPWRPESA